VTRSGQDAAPHLRLAQKHVISHRDSYGRRAFWVRWFFRATGFVLIALSVTLPALVSAEFDHKNLTIGTMSVVIAGLTALRNFFNWDQMWQLMRRTESELSLVIALWDVDIEKIALEPGADAEERALARTRKLIKDAEAIRRAEQTAFFANVRWPGSGNQPNDDRQDPD
jgi:hypothetical protein